MSISKMNIPQAIGSVASLLLYLFLPILSVSVLIPIGFTGETCLQLGGIFVIPVILLGLTLIISLLPIGPYSSIAGIVTGLALLVVGGVSKNSAGAKIDELIALVSMTLDTSALNGLPVGAYAAMMLKMGWGMILPVVVMLLTSIFGMLLSVWLDRQSGSGTHSAAGSYSHSRSYSNPQTRPGASGTTARHSRSTNTSYHR